MKNFIPCEELPTGSRNIVGTRYGRLVVESFGGFQVSKSSKNKVWNCLCDCGNRVLVSSPNLYYHTVSCGCYSREVSRQHCNDVLRKYGTKHGLSQHPLYDTWYGAYRRSCVKSSKDYARYGGRGIGMCDRWKPPAEKGFLNFLEDMGEKPDKEMTIERRDNLKGYSAENCYWAFREDQHTNKSNNRKFPNVYPDGSGFKGLYQRNKKVNYVGMFRSEEEAFMAVVDDIMLKEFYIPQKIRTLYDQIKN